MAQAQKADSGIEYIIYTFDKKSSGDQQNNWQKHSTLSDMGKAMKEAESLYESNKFKRIEVKKKFRDDKKGRTIDMTLKVFETKSKGEIGIMGFIAIALVLGGIAFALTYLLNANAG